MAHATTLESDALQSIVAHVARSLPPDFLSDVANIASLEVAEVFDVWTLNVPFTDDIAASATTTGTVHVQVLSGGTPIGFVRAQKNSDGVWEVAEVLKSAVAGKIAAAIADADSRVIDDTLARLLVVSQYQLLAFWFVEPHNSCYVISCPEKFANLRPGQLLDGPAFLQALRREKPIMGVRKAPKGA